MGILIGIAIAGAALCIWMKKKGIKSPYAYVPKVSSVIALIGILAMLGEESVLDHGSVNKPSPGQEEVMLDLEIKVPRVLWSESYELTLPAQSLTKSQVDKVLEQAKAELDEVMLGENESLDDVTKDLNFQESLQGGLVKASYECEDTDLIEEDGSIVYENTKEEGTITTILVTLTCQEQEKIVTVPICIKEDTSDVKRWLLKEITRKIASSLDRQRESKTLHLPEKIGSYSLTWEDASRTKPTTYIALIVLAILGIEVAKRARKKEEEKKRNQALLKEYPDFLNEMNLLLGAGMNIKGAMERIVEKKEEYKSEPGYLYQELKITCQEMAGGLSQRQAYERFATRCNLVPYRKLVGLWLQNMKKGSVKLRELLQEQAHLALEEQKALARKRGEQISTKLLIPMMMLLAIVMVIMMFPVTQI